MDKLIGIVCFLTASAIALAATQGAMFITVGTVLQGVK